VTATDERRDMKRKLTTIFCADVSGYSRMMGADEARTLVTLKEYREAIEGFIARHHGRVVSWSGDGLLAEFASVVEAVQCAAEVQRELKARNSSREEDLRMTFRIGINLGDVMADGDDIFGEGVNIAARLQQMASPGGILVSSPVYDQVRGKLSMGFAPLGNQSVKNIAGEVGIYAVTLEGVAPHTVPPVQPQRWRDDPQEAPPERTGKRGKLFRRGLAVLVDYMIVLCAVLAGALALNSSVEPTIVRMDLDVPFVDYGDIVERGSWREIASEVGEDARALKEERIVTYDYLGLFTQSYLQTRTRGEAAVEKMIRKEQAKADRERAIADAAEVEARAAEAGIPSPAVPAAPPAPPEPPAPLAAPAALPPADQATEDPGASVSFDYDEKDGLRVAGSYISEQLIDPKTGKPITRPSLDLLSLLLLVLYFTIAEMGRRGSTIGKNAFDLVVTREDGRPLSFPTALVRNLIKVLTSFILPVAILVVLFSRRRQGIHDRLAGTIVVKEGV